MSNPRISQARGGRLLALSLWACTPPGGSGPGAGPRIVDGPALEAHADVPLSRELLVETDRPTALSVRLSSPGVELRVSFPGERTVHRVPLLGAKPGRTTVVEVELVDAEGRAVEATTSFDNDPLEAPWVELELLSADPLRMATGYALLPLQTPDGLDWLAAVDLADGEVGWIYRGEVNFGDVRVTPAGTLLGLSGGGVTELSILGRPLRRMAARDLGPGDVALPWGGLHHELFPLVGGRYASLAKRAVELEPFPKDYDELEVEVAASTVEDAVVVFDDAGAPLGEWWFSEKLDTMHVGWDALDGEWSHANAVIEGLGPGGLVAEARHLDTLFELGPDGELRWILANPLGWRAPWSEALLLPQGPVEWPLHPHGPSVDAEGRLIVFDNGNDGHTPYEPPPTGPLKSRILAYDIDPEAGTVAQAWTWEPPGEVLYSQALGNAAAMADGHVMACFGFLDAEGDGLNADVGRGRKSVRVMEIVPGEAEPVADLRVWMPVEAFPEGVKSYRAVPTPSLYGATATVEWGR